MPTGLSHSSGALKWIEEEMKSRNIRDYRFCLENDCYICDCDGFFYSVCHRQYSKSGRLIEKYRILKLKGSTDRYGYITYRITESGIKKHLKAHRMMLNAWIGEHPDLVVNHKDGNKKNNALSNLEWCSVAENNAHAKKQVYLIRNLLSITMLCLLQNGFRYTSCINTLEYL